MPTVSYTLGKVNISPEAEDLPLSSANLRHTYAAVSSIPVMPSWSSNEKFHDSVRFEFLSGKATGITYSEYVSVELIIQHSKHMRRIIISSVACALVPYFSALALQRLDVQKELRNTKCVF
jgi:hypothetical protein